MNIYIALIKSKDEGHPSRLIVRDEASEMKEYLLTIPARYIVETFAVWDGEKRLVKYYMLKDLVKFLSD